MKDVCSGTRSIRIRVTQPADQKEDATALMIRDVATRTGLSVRKTEDLHRLFTKTNPKATPHLGADPLDGTLTP